MGFFSSHAKSAQFLLWVLLGVTSSTWGKEPIKDRLSTKPLGGSSGVLKGFWVKPPDAIHPIEYPKAQAQTESEGNAPIYRKIDSFSDFLSVTQTAKSRQATRTSLDSPFQKKKSQPQ